MNDINQLDQHFFLFFIFLTPNLFSILLNIFFSLQKIDSPNLRVEKSTEEMKVNVEHLH